MRGRHVATDLLAPVLTAGFIGDRKTHPGPDPPENPVCCSLLTVGGNILNPFFACSNIQPIRHGHAGGAILR